MSLLEELQQIDQDLEKTTLSNHSIDTLLNLKETFFGKKGKISEVMKNIRLATNDEKPLIGKKNK